MEASCKICSTQKEEKKMLRVKFSSKDNNGNILFGAFHYWYFCNPKCLSQYDKEKPVETITEATYDK